MRSRRYQKIISNKDAILEDAQAKADALIADAQAKAQELVTQHEIMQKAYAQANETINAANKQAQEILDSATQDANSIRLSAITYTDDMMANIGSVLNQTLEDAGGKYKGFHRLSSELSGSCKSQPPGAGSSDSTGSSDHRFLP